MPLLVAVWGEGETGLVRTRVTSIPLSGAAACAVPAFQSLSGAVPLFAGI